MNRKNGNDSTEPSAPHSQRVVENLSEPQIARFVSKIKNVELQIGEHVVSALKHADTVAVLTTIVVGPDGSQHIISAALNPQRMAQVNDLLFEAEQERVEDEVCFGFHCLVNPKTKSTK
jgi:hypothetical protein